MGFYSSIEVDYSPLVENAANFCFLTPCGKGGYILENHGNGHYVSHTLATPSARGKPMYRLMQEGFHFLFVHADCQEISTFVADQNIAAIKWSHLAGFKPTFRREPHPMVLFEDQPANCQFFHQTIDDWVLRTKGLKQEGEHFHDIIEAALGHENHPEDPIHDRYVGATMMMCKAGNALKAIPFYNKWAKLAGYTPSTILTLQPLTINIGNAILQMVNGEIDVLKIFA